MSDGSDSELEVCAPRRPTMDGVRDRLRRWRDAALCALVYWALDRLTRNSQLVAHARFELRNQLRLSRHDADRWMADHLVRMVRLFAAEGHSGFSASYAREAFAKLAAFEPLGPLTGAPDEWEVVGEQNGRALHQNRRCSRVFMLGAPPAGEAYDVDGYMFRDPIGGEWSFDCRRPVTFPYTPHTEYVDVDAQGNRIPGEARV